MSKSPVILVTGANRGIGREICRQLAQRGAHVVLTARDEKAARTAAEEISSPPNTVRPHPLDVTDETSIVTLRDFVRREFGRCDVLINNAGIYEDSGSILAIPLGTVRATLETNTFGPLRLAQVFAPLLPRQHGRIVNVSSGAGELEDLDGSTPAYSLSKVALNAVTLMLAAELKGAGIAVNAMCPGWVRTDMGGSAAPRDVQQGADTAVWLALDAPPTLTGKFLRDRKVIPW